MNNVAQVPKSLIERIHDARHVVVVTGAGVSAPSGIPTFRDALTGMWAKFNPAQLATPQAFEADPETVTRWYDQRRIDVLQCRPNAAHIALAEIEKHLLNSGRRFTLLTQNVDRLHHRAGSRNVYELHGSLITWRCTVTGHEQNYEDLKLFDKYPPPSPAGGLLRPAVVWFGEMLPASVMEAAGDAVRSCDVFFSIGTSGEVYPVAGFADIARDAGACACQINLDTTPITPHVDWFIQASCDVAVPKLCEALK